MRSLLSRATIGAIALIVTVSLAACDEDDGPGSAPPSDSPSAPETSSPSDPTVTDSADNLSPVDVVGAWVSAHNAALGSGDTTAVVALTGPDCSTCDELRDSVTTVHRAGGSFRGGRWKVDAAEVTRRTSESATVTAGVTVAAGATKSSRHAEFETYPQERFVLEFKISRGTGHGVVTQIVFLP